MTRLYLYGLIVLAGIVGQVAPGQAKSYYRPGQNSFRLLKGVAFDGHDIKLFKSDTLTNCWKDCLKTRGCRSFVFMQTRGLCWLKSINAGYKLVQKPDSTVGVRRTAKKRSAAWLRKMPSIGGPAMRLRYRRTTRARYRRSTRARYRRSTRARYRRATRTRYRARYRRATRARFYRGTRAGTRVTMSGTLRTYTMRRYGCLENKDRRIGGVVAPCHWRLRWRLERWKNGGFLIRRGKSNRCLGVTPRGGYLDTMQCGSKRTWWGMRYVGPRMIFFTRYEDQVMCLGRAANVTRHNRYLVLQLRPCNQALRWELR